MNGRHWYIWPVLRNHQVWEENQTDYGLELHKHRWIPLMPWISVTFFYWFSHLQSLDNVDRFLVCKNWTEQCLWKRLIVYSLSFPSFVFILPPSWGTSFSGRHYWSGGNSKLQILFFFVFGIQFWHGADLKTPTKRGYWEDTGMLLPYRSCFFSYASFLFP